MTLKRQQKFITDYRDIILDSRLSWAAKGLWVYIFDLPEEQAADIRIKDILKYCNEDVSHILCLLKELKSLDLLMGDTSDAFRSEGECDA